MDIQFDETHDFVAFELQVFGARLANSTHIWNVTCPSCYAILM